MSHVILRAEIKIRNLSRKAKDILGYDLLQARSFLYDTRKRPGLSL